MRIIPVLKECRAVVLSIGDARRWFAYNDPQFLDGRQPQLQNKLHLSFLTQTCLFILNKQV